MNSAVTDTLDERSPETDLVCEYSGLRAIYDFSARQTRRRLLKIVSQTDAARQSNATEPCHQLRVSARRALAAIALAGGCMGRIHVAEIQRELKAAISALSEPCNLGAIIEMLRVRASSLAPDKKAFLDAILERYLRQRRELDTQVVEAVTRLETCCRSHMPQEAVTMGESPRCLASDQAPALFARAARVIDKYIKRVTNCEQDLMSPGRPEQLHRMRLAVMRLRYTMELFEEEYSAHGQCAAEYKAAIAQLERVQIDLGRIHDADVALGRLCTYRHGSTGADSDTANYAERAEALDRNGADQEAFLLRICLEIRIQRTCQYNAFLVNWRQLQHVRFLDGLRDMLGGPVCCAECPEQRRLPRNLRPTVRQAISSG